MMKMGKGNGDEAISQGERRRAEGDIEGERERRRATPPFPRPKPTSREIFHGLSIRISEQESETKSNKRKDQWIPPSDSIKRSQVGVCRTPLGQQLNSLILLPIDQIHTQCITVIVDEFPEMLREAGDIPRCFRCEFDFRCVFQGAELLPEERDAATDLHEGSHEAWRCHKGSKGNDTTRKEDHHQGRKEKEMGTNRGKERKTDRLVGSRSVLSPRSSRRFLADRCLSRQICTAVTPPSWDEEI